MNYKTIQHNFQTTISQKDGMWFTSVEIGFLPKVTLPGSALTTDEAHERGTRFAQDLQAGLEDYMTIFAKSYRPVWDYPGKTATEGFEGLFNNVKPHDEVDVSDIPF